MIRHPVCGRRGLATLLSAAALAACTTSGTSYETAARLPRPDVIIVDRFSVSPDEIQVDEGVVAKVEALAGAPPRAPDERATGRRVADALAEKLVVEIRDMGLPAQLGLSAPPQAQRPLFITGQLVSIDEGNRAERVIVGLGAGRSDVRVQAQVYDGTGGGRRLVEEIEVDAKSGLAPGMLETMGAGALTGHLLAATVVSTGLHVASEEFSTDVVADADRAARGLGKQLAAFFGQQGWTR